jgi:hypothetical protein
MKKLLALTLATVVTAFDTVSAVALSSRESTGAGPDAVKASHLTFMREEEKLARDVYLTLAGICPNQAVFNTIASTLEQTHTDTMRDKLIQFNVPASIINPPTPVRRPAGSDRTAWQGGGVAAVVAGGKRPAGAPAQTAAGGPARGKCQGSCRIGHAAAAARWSL